MLIHANHRWPEAITANLWPYAIRAANDSLNATPCARHKFKSTPLQIFSRTDVDVNPKHWIPFGSPVYVLENKLQAAHPIYENEMEVTGSTRNLLGAITNACAFSGTGAQFVNGFCIASVPCCL